VFLVVISVRQAERGRIHSSVEALSVLIGERQASDLPFLPGEHCSLCFPEMVWLLPIYVNQIRRIVGRYVQLACTDVVKPEKCKPPLNSDLPYTFRQVENRFRELLHAIFAFRVVLFTPFLVQRRDKVIYNVTMQEVRGCFRGMFFRIINDISLGAREELENDGR